MESQPKNPEFRINPENFHPCNVNQRLRFCSLGLNMCGSCCIPTKFRIGREIIKFCYNI